MDTIFGLIFGCPFEKSAKDCPLNDIRQRSIAERIEWVENLQDKENVRILQHHKVCLLRRERGEEK